MPAPCHFTSPDEGMSSPQRMRSRLVLPLPFAPATRSSSPPESASDSPRNSVLPPRSHSRLTASSTGYCCRNRHLAPHGAGLTSRQWSMPAWTRFDLRQMASPRLLHDGLKEQPMTKALLALAIITGGALMTVDLVHAQPERSGEQIVKSKCIT